MKTHSNRRNLAVLGISVTVPLAVSFAYLRIAGFGDEQILVTLRLTAHLAVIVFLLAFVARPLRQLFRTRFTQQLIGQRRQIGIAFAGVHTAHLLMIVLRARENDEFSLTVSDNGPGTIVYVLIYLMLITSFDWPARAIGRRAWRVLHKVGLYVIFVAFVQTQLPDDLADLSGMNWWLVALIIGALLIRMTAFFARLGGVR